MFILFGGDTYYPGGGMADYRGKYETLDNAIIAAKTQEFSNEWTTENLCQWWHVLDLDSWQIVASSEGDEEMSTLIQSNINFFS